MAITRLYVVIQEGKPNRLIEATSLAQAIRHCATQEYSGCVARPKDVAHILSLGATVEKAIEINDQTTPTTKEQTNGTHPIDNARL
jgi:hypothetical protein